MQMSFLWVLNSDINSFVLVFSYSSEVFYIVLYCIVYVVCCSYYHCFYQVCLFCTVYFPYITTLTLKYSHSLAFWIKCVWTMSHNCIYSVIINQYLPSMVAHVLPGLWLAHFRESRGYWVPCFFHTNQPNNCIWPASPQTSAAPTLSHTNKKLQVWTWT